MKLCRQPYLQRIIERSCKAIEAAGLHVTGIKPDGTVFCSEIPVSEMWIPPGLLDPRAGSRSAGFVYFIGDGDFIKIGFATDLQARLKSLQTACSRPLALLAAHEGGQQDERQLHRRFAGLRVRGEWFRPAQEILDYISVHQARGIALDGA